ncbi:T-cell surface glycoprotein CD3 epsilon chain-like [Mugil cephalus]|uniref:T-cell surface glycoprotein CD3 epsilon chain-like n=1 Tax=Mugil cephalus TaxID=48193 RepID=UPI001FB805B8|nr:T-cell surface glycoprotein CD3 epsilon chain-like [Mugil cephalus]
MDVHVVLVVFLMFAGTVKAEGGVTFWGNMVKLTCPGRGMFYKDNVKVNVSRPGEYEFDYKGKVTYSCVYEMTDSNEQKHRVRYLFYVKAKTCENCFELDAVLFAVAIVGDLIFTSVIMIAIYKCTKKKNPAASNNAAPKAPGRSGGRPPPVPSVDYEPLNLNTRSHDTYSMVNRTG